MTDFLCRIQAAAKTQSDPETLHVQPGSSSKRLRLKRNKQWLAVHMTAVSAVLEKNQKDKGSMSCNCQALHGYF